MQKNHVTRRATSLLLLLATLIACFAALLPTTASAEPVGDVSDDIQDFAFQTISSATQNDATTDLRFMFTIGSLAYNAVGFVFSTSNSAPTANPGGAGTYSTDTVYRVINAGNGNMEAPTNRYWVAVKLSDIPLASFETTIYVRPFIKVGGDYFYIDAKQITVCEALTIDKTVAGESAIYNSKSPSGTYADGNDFMISQTIGAIRGANTENEQHFFPTTDDPTYKQLYIEYSFLWNETLANALNARMSLASFGGKWGDRELFGLYVGDADGRSAGSFDLCFGENGKGVLTECVNLWGHSAESGVYTGAKKKADFETLGENYGWHRIGIVFDNSVWRTLGSNLSDDDMKRVTNDGHKVEYYGEIYLYVDGNLVWKCRANIQGNWNSKTYKWDNNDGFRSKRAMPFMATSNVNTSDSEFAGGIVYNGVKFVDLDNVTVNMTINDVADSTEAVYIAVSDVHFTCGKGFVRKVKPVAAPTERTVNLGGNEYPANIWYVFDNTNDD